MTAQTKGFRTKAVHNRRTRAFSVAWRSPEETGNCSINWPMDRVMVLRGKRTCWDRNELLLEWMFFDHKDMVSIVCSLGSGEICRPTEVFELAFNDEQESDMQRETGRNIPE